MWIVSEVNLEFKVYMHKMPFYALLTVSNAKARGLV